MGIWVPRAAERINASSPFFSAPDGNYSSPKSRTSFNINMFNKLAFWKPAERRVLLLGLDDTGKTSLLYRWLLNEVIDVIPTQGFNIETVKYPKGYALTLWDIGGCDMMRALYRHYYLNTEAIIFFHDCTDESRLEEALRLLEDTAKAEDLHAVPILVLLNKQDRLHGEKGEAIVAHAKAGFESLSARLSRKAPIKVLDCPGFSGTKMENPHVALDEVAAMITSQSPGKDKTAKLEKALGSDGMSDKDRAKSMADGDDLSPEAFWTAFEDGSLAPWNHYNHLKAGFLVLIGALEKGQSVLTAAETFIGHLERLRANNPERFRNTTHRTMTMFWLAQLQIAAANYSDDQNLKRSLNGGDFKNVLLFAPQLTDSRLWAEYYSKDRLFTQAYKDEWRHPDIQPLPAFVHRRADKGAPPTMANQNRLIGVGLSVIEETISSGQKRGAVAKSALSRLEKATMQDRAVSTAVAPYSETQAYFWIQIVQAALASELDTGVEKEKFELVPSLTVPEFKARFGIRGDEWKAYYSEKVWDSVRARMQFFPPDKKPLPNVIHIH